MHEFEWFCWKIRNPSERAKKELSRGGNKKGVFFVVYQFYGLSRFFTKKIMNNKLLCKIPALYLQCWRS
jgi:hypothetical protein